MNLKDYFEVFVGVLIFLTIMYIVIKDKDENDYKDDDYTSFKDKK